MVERIDQIREVADAVRAEFFSRRSRAQDVCDIAAPTITRRLQKLGIEAKTIRGLAIPTYDVDEDATYLREHYWTEADGLLVDITIDQLHGDWPKVLIDPIEKCRDHPSWRIIYCPLPEFYRAMNGRRKLLQIDAIRDYRSSVSRREPAAAVMTSRRRRLLRKSPFCYHVARASKQAEIKRDGISGPVSFVAGDDWNQNVAQDMIATGDADSDLRFVGCRMYMVLFWRRRLRPDTRPAEYRDWAFYAEVAGVHPSQITFEPFKFDPDEVRIIDPFRAGKTLPMSVLKSSY